MQNILEYHNSVKEYMFLAVVWTFIQRTSYLKWAIAFRTLTD